MEKEITLLQALTGVDFVIEHLDGSKIRIQNTPGEVIKPDDIKTVLDKGLPFHRQPYKNGNLYVVFKVGFPKTLPKAVLANVSEALKAQKAADVDMDAGETVKLSPYDEKSRNTQATGGTENPDEEDEDEDPRGGQRVQCQQQ
jgi:DnaJ-class molecular chaperone